MAQTSRCYGQLAWASRLSETEPIDPKGATANQGMAPHRRFISADSLYEKNVSPGWSGDHLKDSARADQMEATKTVQNDQMHGRVITPPDTA